MKRYKVCLSLLLFFLPLTTDISFSRDAKEKTTDKAASFGKPDTKWVRKTLKRLSLREKVAQLVQIRIFGRYYHQDSPEFQSLLQEVKENKVGGLILFAGTVYESAQLINRLQSAAPLPLIVSADFESGAAFRISDTTPFPWTMAMGATGSEELAYRQGTVTARESRALGVHWVYAPVMDVNNNPDNPVIGIRSYGEDPRLVARLGSAFIRGCRDGGVMTTAKHFPGHGNTATDSHIGMARIPADRAGLESMELIPFRAAIQAGVDSIMTAHLSIPNLTGEPETPATLSSKILTRLLREDLKFPGIVVTDALEMGGIAGRFWGGKAAVMAVQAGADVLILPPDNQIAIEEIVRAVGDGRIPASRIDQSVEKLLLAKTRLGLHKRRITDCDQISQVIAHPENRALAQDIADRSVTLVRNENRLLPWNPIRPPKIFHVIFSGSQDTSVLPVFQAEMQKRFPDSRIVMATPQISAEKIQEILQAASAADSILCSTPIRTASASMPGSLQTLAEQLLSKGKPVSWVSFGTPYLLRLFPQPPSAYLCTFSYSDVSQIAAAKALSGEIGIRGKMPVSIPDRIRIGEGLETAPIDNTLRFTPSSDSVFSEKDFQPIKDLLKTYVDRKAFPGASLMVGYRGQVVLNAAIGRMDYSDRSDAVSSDTIYDLASVSKAVGTTSAAMQLIESGRLLLHAPVMDYLPEFQGPGKDKILVRHLLEHRAGLPAFLPFYKEAKGYAAVLQKVCQTPLEADPDTRTKYSDLGMILAGEIIARTSGKTLDQFLSDEIFRALGMNSTSYRPPRTWKKRIAPTEQDPWRGYVVHGEVHDENAFAMGGVAGHAGLFSSSRDLAVFAQMMLNRGLYQDRRFIRASTITQFTTAQNIAKGNNRGLGWGKPLADYWTGSVFSPQAFGHTGFTGTMIWIDPERDCFLVLLTNRVHPSRNNQLVDEAREKICQETIRILDQRK